MMVGSVGGVEMIIVPENFRNQGRSRTRGNELDRLFVVMSQARALTQLTALLGNHKIFRGGELLPFLFSEFVELQLDSSIVGEIFYHLVHKFGDNYSI